MAYDLRFRCRFAGGHAARSYSLDQPAENLVTSHPGRRQVGDRSRDALSAVWGPQVPGQARTILVVTRDVRVQDCVPEAWPGDQHQGERRA
jgi:hypothetical protein